MSSPQFAPGEAVRLRRNPQGTGEGLFEIVRIVPTEGTEPRYHIRSLGQSTERMVDEHELDKAIVEAPNTPPLRLPNPRRR